MADRPRRSLFSNRRRSKPEALSAPAPAVTGKPLGRSGTVNTRGFISTEEINQRLVFPNNLREYDIMRKTDATVRWSLGLLKLPLRAADAFLEPPKNPTPEELEATAFAEQALFEELAGGFDEALRRALTFVEMGHAVLEPVAELRQVNFSYEVKGIEVPEPAPAPPPPQVPPKVEPGQPQPPIPPPHPPPAPKPVPTVETKTVNREAFVIAKLGERLQRTLWEWHPRDDDPSVLDHIVQRPLDGRSPNPIELPGNRLLIFTHEQEGDDWRGASVLRSAWKPYFEKLELENMEAIGLERTAGLPVVYPPENADDDQMNSVEEAVKKLRQGANLYIIMPGPKASSTGGADAKEGWLIEDLAIKGQGDGESAMDKAILRKEATLARNVFAEFMRLGHANVGARATSESQSDPYYLAVTALGHYVAEVFSNGIIRPLVEWNYDVQRFPKLRFGKIQAAALQVVAQAVAELLNAGGIEGTPELEEWLRRTLDAPEKPLEYNQAPSSPPSPPPSKTDEGTEEPGKGDAPGEAKGNALSVRFSQFVPRRPLMGAEQHVSWQQVQDTLDNGAEDLIAVAEQVMKGQLDSATAGAAEAIAANDPARLDRLALDPTPLADALEAELHRLYGQGAADVRAEVRRQLAARQQGDAAMAVPKIPLTRADVEAVIKATAKAMAEEAAAAALRAIKQRALKTITQRKETPPAPFEDAVAEMRGALRKSAPLATNRIYSLGRMDEIRDQHYAGMVPAVRYSAVLDENTCEECLSMDGMVTSVENAPEVPNPLCEGGDRCRCQILPELAAPGELEM